MIAFAIVVSFITVLILLSPFVFGKGGTLQESASINSPERLVATQDAILKRYLEDERLFEEKRITKLTWDQRKSYLTNRYLDTSRRLDYIKHLLAEQKNRGQ
ncbi:MAG: hypothetical protein ACOVS5_06680 [Oligoflexus sp.]|jgi:hypothetical protein